MSYGFKLYDYCMRCGKIFKRAYATQDYCSLECKRGKLKPKSKPEISIVEITRLASAEHLTYGKHCAKHGL